MHRDLVSTTEHSFEFAENSLRRCAATILCLLLALFASLLMESAVPHGYLLILVVACGFVGWIAGAAYGVSAAILAAIAADYFFLNSLSGFRISFTLFPSALAFFAAALGAGWLAGTWRKNRERLKQSREQLTLLLDGVKDHAVFLLDAQGRVATWNTGAQRIKGYTQQEILGKHHSIFYLPEEIHDKPQELLQRAAKQGSVLTQGHRVRKDGTCFWAEVAVTALYANDGSIRGYAKTTRDISELRASHQALEAKEEELRAVVESAPDAVLMVNEEGTILFANAETESMFGYSLAELLGKKIELLVPKSKRTAHVADRDKYCKAPHRRPMGMGLDLFALRKDGRELPVEISLGPVESSLERRFVASVRDITERRLMERELQDRKIQELAQLMIRDLDGRIVQWSAGMSRMYGYSRAEAEGAISHHLLRTSFPAQMEQIEAELIRTGYWQGELRHIRKNGEPIYVNSSWALHRDKDGKPCRVLESDVDITALKNAEERARELNSELEKQNTDLSLAKAVIEAQTQKIAVSAKMSALGEMAGGMAHEINNPMGIIHARASDLLEMAQDTDAVPSQSVIQTMEKIRSTAARVTKIILGLRKFARETRNDPFVEVSVRDILEDTLSFCTQRLKQYSVELRVMPTEPSLRITCRPTEISQVLLNILNNAVDAVQSLREKWIELVVSDCGDFLDISVTDSGSGIPEEVRQRMGQPFFTTKEVGRGTGLGLSISRGIVEMHGGRLVLDAESQHTRFVISLPKSVTRQKEALHAAR